MNTELISLASRMIEVQSLSEETDKNRQVLDIADKYLKNVHSHTFEREATGKNGEKFTVLSRLWGDPNTLMTPRLLLSGHVDVVDAESPTSPLWSPKIQNGRLYGRGSGDMKGYDAAMLVAYKRWIEETGGPNGVGLLLSSDEEIGGANGTRYTVSQGLTPEVVFIPDGEFNFNIVDKEKGPFHFLISATSETKGGHVAMAFQFDNPINRLLGMYQEAKKIFSVATPENQWDSTFEMTLVNTANTSLNKLPDSVTAGFGWRFPVELWDYKSRRDQLLDLCAKYGLVVEHEEGGGDGFKIDQNAPYVQLWKSTIEQVLRRPVGFVPMHGATDGRHFYASSNRGEYGTKNVLVTSGISEGMHAKNESVDIDSLRQLSEAIYQYEKTI